MIVLFTWFITAGRVLTFLEKCLNFDPPGKLLE
jgi:hypothetical protein